MAGAAPLATAAEDGGAGDDVAAGLEVGHALAHGLYDASRLVAEDDGWLEGPGPVYEVQVAMAQAR